jgi:Domain of unknown function (DUF4342)
METIKVDGAQILEQVKRILHEGNVRRIIVKHEGRTVAEFPLTVGVVGAALAPVLVAVGAIAALLTESTIEIERAAEGESSGGAEASPPTTPATTSGPGGSAATPTK